MANYILTILMIMTMAAPAQAWFGRGKNKNTNTAPTIAECAQSLSRSTGASQSLTNRACQNGRTDGEFQACTRNLALGSLGDSSRIAEAGYFCANGYAHSNFMQKCTLSLQNYFGRDPQYIPYSVSICKQARDDDFPDCVGELFSKAGQQANTAAQLCLNGRDKALNNCLITRFKETGNAASANSFCSNATNKARYGNPAKTYPLEEKEPVVDTGVYIGDSSSSGNSSGVLGPSTSFSNADLADDGRDGGVLVDLPMPK